MSSEDWLWDSDTATQDGRPSGQIRRDSDDIRSHHPVRCACWCHSCNRGRKRQRGGLTRLSCARGLTPVWCHEFASTERGFESCCYCRCCRGRCHAGAGNDCLHLLARPRKTRFCWYKCSCFKGTSWAKDGHRRRDKPKCERAQGPTLCEGHFRVHPCYLMTSVVTCFSSDSPRVLATCLVNATW